MRVFLLFVLPLFCIILTVSAEHVPVIGVLSHPSLPQLEHFGSYYIASSYIKWIELGGSRAVPIQYSWSDNDIISSMQKLDGIFLPGGEDSHDLQHKACVIYNEATRLNRKRPFVLFGTCLGFEQMAVCEGAKLDVFNANDISLNLQFTTIGYNSRLFEGISQQLLSSVQKNNITFNNHRLGVSMTEFMRSGMDSKYILVTFNSDRNGLKFVSAFEHKKFPFFAVQFHPEKPIYEFDNSQSVPHDQDSVLLGQHFSNILTKHARNAQGINTVAADLRIVFNSLTKCRTSIITVLGDCEFQDQLTRILRSPPPPFMFNEIHPQIGSVHVIGVLHSPAHLTTALFLFINLADEIYDHTIALISSLIILSSMCLVLSKFTNELNTIYQQSSTSFYLSNLMVNLPSALILPEFNPVEPPPFTSFFAEIFVYYSFNFDQKFIMNLLEHATTNIKRDCFQEFLAADHIGDLVLRLSFRFPLNYPLFTPAVAPWLLASWFVPLVCDDNSLASRPHALTASECWLFGAIVSSTLTHFMQAYTKLDNFHSSYRSTEYSLYSCPFPNQSITLQDYVNRLITYSQASPAVFVIMLILIDRVRRANLGHPQNPNPFVLTSDRCFKLIIAAFTVAYKISEENDTTTCQNNAFFAKLGGITTAELALLEMDFLFGIRFALKISQSTFEQFVNVMFLHFFVGQCPQCLRFGGFFSDS
ncbi:hypothetical protein P9112_007285 [Eukaryota sp. TZLM1-RC]